MIYGKWRYLYSAFSADAIRRVVYPIDVEVEWGDTTVSDIESAQNLVNQGKIRGVLNLRLQRHQVGDEYMEKPVSYGESITNGLWTEEGVLRKLTIEVPYALICDQEALIKVLNLIFVDLFEVPYVFTKTYIIQR